MEDPGRAALFDILARCSGGDHELLREWQDNVRRGLLPHGGEWVPADRIAHRYGRRRASRVGLVEVWVLFAMVALIELVMLLIARGLHS